MLVLGKPGELIKGELHSADASAGVQVPIYNEGTTVARTLAANEYLVIHAFEFVTVAGGDCRLVVNTTAAATAGTIVFRGTFAANGGLAMNRIDFEGIFGGLPFLTAPVGVVDIVFYGSVHVAEGIKTRPSWRESMIPGV